MSEFVGVTSGLEDNEWTDALNDEGDVTESGLDDWAVAMPTKTAKPNVQDMPVQQTAPGKACTASEELGLFTEGDKDPASVEFPEDAKNGDNWSWGAAWSAFTTAVQQDVKEIAGSVQKGVSTTGWNFQPDEKPQLLPGEVIEQDDRNMSGSDKELDAGLGAIDQQVDQIANAVGKGLGSLWTGIGGAITSTAQAASSVAGQLEQAAMQATTTNGRRSSPWSTRAFGRSQGPWVMPRDGTQEDEWQVLDLLGSPATSVAASFEQLFKLYRGHRFSEELEAIGNEASRSCNRVRTQLPESQRAELDAIITQTAAHIDLLATLVPTQDAHSAARALVHDIPSSSQHLENGSLPIAHRGGPREGLASMSAAAVDRALHMLHAMSTESPQQAWEGLCRVRAEGLKLLAEFTALSIQHMAFLAMCLEGGDAEAAGLQFLPDGSNKAMVVRGVLLQLLSDTDAIFEAFYTALEQATEDEEFAAMLLDQPADDGSDVAADEMGLAQQHSSLSEISGGTTRDASLQPNMALVVGELKGGLLVGVKAAVERIMQGSRNLVYPICAPAAVRLDAETGLSPGLSPIPDRQAYEHVPDPQQSFDADEAHGSGPMARNRTTSLSNPLFETVGAVASHVPSELPVVAPEKEDAAAAGPATSEPPAASQPPSVSQPPAAAAVEAPVAESPLPFGAGDSSVEVTANPPAAEEEDSLTQVQPPRLGSEAETDAAQNAAQVQEPKPSAEPTASDAVSSNGDVAVKKSEESDGTLMADIAEPKAAEAEVPDAPANEVNKGVADAESITAATASVPESKIEQVAGEATSAAEESPPAVNEATPAAEQPTTDEVADDS